MCGGVGTVAYGYCCRPNGCGRMASVLGHLADNSSHVAAAGQLHRGCAMWTAVRVDSSMWTAVHVDSCIVRVQCGQLSTWTVASSVCNVDSCPHGHLHRRCAMWTAVHVDSSMWTAVDSCPRARAAFACHPGRGALTDGVVRGRVITCRRCTGGASARAAPFWPERGCVSVRDAPTELRGVGGGVGQQA